MQFVWKWISVKQKRLISLLNSLTDWVNNWILCSISLGNLNEKSFRCTLSSVSSDIVSLQQRLVPQGNLPVRRGSQSLGHAEEPHEPLQEGQEPFVILGADPTIFSFACFFFYFLLILSRCTDCPKSWMLEKWWGWDANMSEDERPSWSHYGGKNWCVASLGEWWAIPFWKHLHKLGSLPGF